MQACKPVEKERLVWLAPSDFCQEGEPGFGADKCFIRRLRDAVAVLRVPAGYGHSQDNAQLGGFEIADVAFLPDGVASAEILRNQPQWEKVQAEAREK
jgi:hypothetical protein